MKAYEMINKLYRMPPNAEVYYTDYAGNTVNYIDTIEEVDKNNVYMIGDEVNYDETK